VTETQRCHLRMAFRLIRWCVVADPAYSEMRKQLGREKTPRQRLDVAELREMKLGRHLKIGARLVKWMQIIQEKLADSNGDQMMTMLPGC
jgi:hypothetical protein